MRRYHTQLLLILLLAITMQSAATGSDYSNMIVEHYGEDRGLPNNIVNCSLKSRDGFLWFGTWYGLSRFDGTKFYTYNKAIFRNSNQPPRKIESMVEDANGNIWIKTLDWKLYIFYKGTEIFRSVYDEIKPYSHNIQVIKIQRTADGSVMLLTKDKELLLGYTDKVGSIKIHRLIKPNGSVNPFSLQLQKNIISETRNYISWEGMNYTIKTIRKASAAILLNSLKAENFTCAYQRGKYELYAGCEDGKVYLIDALHGKVKQLFSAKKEITNIVAVSPTDIYITVAGKSSYRNGRLINLSLSTNISASYVDRYGKLWFCDDDRAAVCYDPVHDSSTRYPFTLFGKICEPQIQDAGSHGLFFLSPAGEAFYFDRIDRSMHSIAQMPQIVDDAPNQRFFNLYMDKEGLLWLSSTNCGVYKFNFPLQQFHMIKLPSNPLESDKNKGVRSIYQMKNGDIWVGTRSKDLYVFDINGHLKKTYSYSKYHIGSVYYIMMDRKNNLWLSTKGDGLVKAVTDKSLPDGFRFIHYKHDAKDVKSISGNNVYMTYMDDYSRIWVCTLDGGLNLISENGDNIEFKNKYNGFFHYPQYGQYMEARNMVEDRSGRIWVGTIDGLMSFESKFTNVHNIRFETYHRKNLSSFANNDVYALYKDNASNIWMCAFGGGINRLDSYDRDNHIPSFSSLGAKEGMQSNVVVSMVSDSHNRLWFGSDKGLSCYNPKTDRVRNFDKYDGFSDVTMEETASLYNRNGTIWMGCKQGILVFNPYSLKTSGLTYKTYIVDCEVNNRNIRSYTDNPIIDKDIAYTDKIVLSHNQNMFTIEFAALNFNNQNRISYRYRLKGYDRDWHYNGNNRIASYTNVPSGEYTFEVETMDGANPELKSGCSLQVVILSPWWASWWAYIIYSILSLGLIYGSIRLSLYMIKMRNDVYIGHRLAELKIRFFTNISHELRTPLTLIQGSIQELKEREKLSDKGKSYVSLMEKNSTQMIQLVNQILDFRKIQNGKMRLHVSSVSMHGMMEAFMEEFRVLADEHNIKFTLEMPDGDIMVWADEERLEIVVRNILANAFKFTPQDGIITLTVESEREGLCRITIENSGSHIPENKLFEIFERFSQADNNENAKYQGTGIGLAVSKEIMHLHHGHIYAENSSDSSVRFVVEVPVEKEKFTGEEVDFYISGNEMSKAADDTLERGPELLEQTSNNEKELPAILLVDDNHDLCDMLKLQLEGEYKVHVAYDGKEGLLKVNKYHPDIVITDQMMPNMDGLELLHCIRTDFQISHIPVIILTAKGDDESKTKAISMGANAYITKPFSKDYLLASITQLLKERRAFRDTMLANGNVASDEYSKYLEQKDVKFIKEIHQVIEDNIDNSDFNIDLISSTIGLSRSAFFKKVKSLTGYAPVDLIKEYRINKSLELMRTTDFSITEIAFKSGFKDSGYFGKCFRKRFGKSPREYISEIRK